MKIHGPKVCPKNHPKAYVTVKNMRNDFHDRELRLNENSETGSIHNCEKVLNILLSLYV